MSSSPCTSPNSLTMLRLKVSQTSWSSASALSRDAVRKQTFYWRTLLKWKRRESVKFETVRIWVENCVEWSEVGSALYLIPSTLPISPAGSTSNHTLVQTFCLLTAYSLLSVGVWICKKHAKPGSGYLCNFLSDLSLPHKTSSLKHLDFPFCALGYMNPCEKLWLGREAGQRPEASQMVVFGAGVSTQGLLWPKALPLCELTEQLRSSLGTS